MTMTKTTMIAYLRVRFHSFRSLCASTLEVHTIRHTTSVWRAASCMWGNQHDEWKATTTNAVEKKKWNEARRNRKSGLCSSVWSRNTCKYNSVRNDCEIWTRFHHFHFISGHKLCHCPNLTYGFLLRFVVCRLSHVGRTGQSISLFPFFNKALHLIHTFGLLDSGCLPQSGTQFHNSNKMIRCLRFLCGNTFTPRHLRIFTFTSVSSLAFFAIFSHQFCRQTFHKT